MPSSIVRLTTTDHGRLLRLLNRAVAPGPSQHRWRAEAVRLLRAHREAEREVVTPEVLAPAGPGALDALARLVLLDTDLARLGARLADPATPTLELADIGRTLSRLLERHADLSRQMLQPLEQCVTRKQIRALGGRYGEARDTALRDQGAAEPPPRRFDLPRAELYELARKAGIEGRSAMSRAELISELMRRQDA